VVNCWTHEHSLNLLEPCVGAADRGPNLEFRPIDRLSVSLASENVRFSKQVKCPV
jgi:hypothetical protein